MKLVTVVGTMCLVQTPFNLELPIRKFLPDEIRICLPWRVPIRTRAERAVLPSTDWPYNDTTSTHFAFHRLQNGPVTASLSVRDFVARWQQRIATDP
jgi:hypothetical protein